MEYFKWTASSVANGVSAVAAKAPKGTGKVVALGAAGAAALPLVGVTAGALVPSAMSFFGTVVPGVGTFHAAGGVAATLQYSAASYATASAATMGGIAGLAAGTTTEVGKRVGGWFGY